VHFYSIFWRKLILNRGTLQSPPSAVPRSTRRPVSSQRTAPSQGTRTPRRHPLPHPRTPRRRTSIGSPRGPSAVACPRVPEVPRASDGPLVLGTRLHVAYIDRHLPVRASLPRPSRRRRAGRAAAVNSLLRPAACNSSTSSTFLDTYHSSPACRPSRRAAHRAGPAVPAPAAGRPSPNQCPKPNPRLPRTLLRPFPGQKPRRPRRIPAARAGRPPRGPHCKHQNLSRVFIAKR
jgi:hypothetical protein